jgi:hypothetical protein
MTNTDLGEAGARLRALVATWLEQANQSGLEATRIYNTVKVHTDAQERCYARADVWKKCAAELDALLSAPVVSPPPEDEERCESIRDGRRCTLLRYHDASMNATAHLWEAHVGEAGARLRALVAQAFKEGFTAGEYMSGALSASEAWEQSGTLAQLDGKLEALLLVPVVSPPQEEVIVNAYQKAQELWSSQCFCFTSAPETVRRAAHEVARDGFNELAGILGPLARPVLDAEYRAAEAEAKKASAVVTQEGE